MFVTFPALNLLLPVVLGIHNYEEYSRYDEFVAGYPGVIPKQFTTRKVIRNAAVLLTLAGAAISLLTFARRSDAWILVSKIAVFALLLNSLGHCVQSLRQHRLTPGTRSALALVLPYCMAVVALMHFSLGDSVASLLRFAAMGAIAIPVVIVLSILLGYGMSRIGHQLRG